MSTSNINKGNENKDFEMFNMVLKNEHTIAGKVFADIPLKLLEVGDYQRVEFASEKKILQLAASFDKNLMDPLTVVAHPEEGKFYVINGYHRKRAVEINGKDDSIACEILQNLSDDPVVRRREEADLFRRQMETLDKLSPVAMHKANLICNDIPSWHLDQLVSKYGINYKTNLNRGRCVNTLTGFTTALRVSKVYGKEMLDDIFYVLHKSMWTMESKGLGNVAISILRNIFVYDPETRENKDKIVEIFREISPKKFIGRATTRYETRSENVAASLYLEDLLIEELGIDDNIHKKYNVA